GGLPLGMAFDNAGNLLVCVGGMGLYSIAPDGTPTALATQTKRSKHRIRDDSAIRLADDLDIAPDGKVYFSDATTRFDGIEYMFDVTEARPNGRILCFDPQTGETTTVVKNIPFPNGVCTAHDGRSILVASTITCSVWRYWLEGPDKGTFVPFLTELPGFPDNINRAEDGTYWMAFCGMRTPAFDLALRDAGWRRRMLKQIPQDEWLMFNMNTSCVFKFDEDGKVLESYWDETQEDHSVITSMREYGGYLFLGGLHNDRVGRIPLQSSDAAVDAPADTRKVVRSRA
ncbi:MAG: transporter permease, partial [Marmoricola sp.]|nr:transporter permease [Marmoricola sp.]